jgi:phosphate transport system substrate-binding protein
MQMMFQLQPRTLRVAGAVLFALIAPGALAAQALTGAGATFPGPIYEKWFDAYRKKTGVKINYQAVGSGAGITQYTNKTVDFGATDGPMNPDQMNAVQGDVVHIPTVMGAVVLTWNLPSLGDTQLKLDGATIADIFLGKITKWNSPRLTALNPGVKLPGDDIIVAHRADGSGTTYIFADYLAKVSPEWKQKVGVGNSLNWPTGLGGAKNDGVTQQVKQNPGAIGYVELIYAIQQKMPYAQVRNSTGAFVNASLESVTAAAASAKFEKNTDFRVSITNAPGAGSYPISSFTWLLVRPDMKDVAKGKALKNFVEWMVTPEAQAMAKTLAYAPLPQEVIGLITARAKTLKANGKLIM